MWNDQFVQANIFIWGLLRMCVLAFKKIVISKCNKILLYHDKETGLLTLFKYLHSMNVIKTQNLKNLNESRRSKGKKAELGEPLTMQERVFHNQNNYIYKQQHLSKRKIIKWILKCVCMRVSIIIYKRSQANRSWFTISCRFYTPNTYTGTISPTLHSLSAHQSHPKPPTLAPNTHHNRSSKEICAPFTNICVVCFCFIAVWVCWVVVGTECSCSL